MSKLTQKLCGDLIDKELVLVLQQGLPISARPFKALAEDMDLSEDEILDRIQRLRREGLLRGIGFGFDTRKLGLASTLVACKIPRKKIAVAKKVIAGYKNITHNYLRRHRLNMWFTLSALSQKKIHETLAGIQNQLGATEMVSLPTKQVFKLGFRLHAH